MDTELSAMIRTFLKRCFLAGLLISMFSLGTAACCCFLACSPPDYYATSLDAPIDEADVDAAWEEMEQMVGDLRVFVTLDANAREQLQWDRQDTTTVALTERHLNACLHKKTRDKNGDLRQPHVSLQGDVIRFAVTLATPLAEVPLSCEFEPVETQRKGLTFELHTVNVGRLPLPAKLILKQLLRTKPRLPRGIELNVDGEYPTIAFTELPNDGKLQIDRVAVADGELQLTFRRTADTVVAVNR